MSESLNVAAISPPHKSPFQKNLIQALQSSLPRVHKDVKDAWKSHWFSKVFKGKLKVIKGSQVIQRYFEPCAKSNFNCIFIGRDFYYCTIRIFAPVQAF